MSAVTILAARTAGQTQIRRCRWGPEEHRARVRPAEAGEALARTGASGAGGRLLIGYHRKMQGSLFGGANPLYDISMILSLWPRWSHQAHGTHY